MKDPPASIVYSPEPLLRDPKRLFSAMWDDLLASRELAWRLIVRNIRAQYRQTALGYVWAFLPPLAMTLVWVMLRSQNVISVWQTEIPYAAYVLIGTVLWQVFLEALNSPLKLVTTSKQMLSKVNFPREALIVAGVGEVVFSLFVRLVLLVAVLGWFRIQVPKTVLLVPVGVTVLIAFGVMVGLFLAPIGVLFQDIQYGVATLTTFWFFLTPVVYPPPTQGVAAVFIRWNPVSPILLVTRDWCTTGTTLFLGPFLVVSALTFVLITVGWLLYRLAMPHVIARISA